VVGLPLGIFVFLHVSVDLLKLLAGVAVLFMAFAASGRFGSFDRNGDAEGARSLDIGVGVLSGLMSACLAMPGPVAAARMAALRHAKDTIRATILVLFVFSYGAAIALQAALVGVSWDTLSHAATLTPATLIGIYLGRKSVAWISERTFRRLIVALLLVTSVSLLVNSFVALF
jgi:uncharacterized membrane protein YfcA